MSLTRTMLGLVSTLTLGVLAVGCASSAEGAPKVTLSGNTGTGSTLATRSWGRVDAHGSAHVVAHELYKNGSHGRNVDVVVGADGYFSVAIDRGARWVVTVDGADGSSSVVVFDDGKTVLDVGASGGEAHVDFGKLHVSGGQATADVTIDGTFGLAATLAAAGEIFEAANGAIVEADKALAEAQQAVADAEKQANDAAAQAQQAADDARKRAGL